jgi:hypothetical protein
MTLKSKSRFRKILVRAILAVLIVFIVVIISLSLWIELELKKICETATQKYSGDKVEALILSVETKRYGLDVPLYKANNGYIWALGQLGDKRSLPFLRSISTGKPCDHETNLCQEEIQEAIQKLESNKFNLPKFLWRGIVN